ncbi:MAG: DUF1206 domain-containing protein [Chloroflexi bacterium]|nr:MAG: DUF1206 domain-containing protein [Chloroflexota bacterium]TMG59107.1 MAG: DUF1206 domain-containing protein [Chloroflexota bacterium]
MAAAAGRARAAAPGFGSAPKASTRGSPIGVQPASPDLAGPGSPGPVSGPDVDLTAMASVHRVAQKARSATRRGVSNPWLEFLERVGYVMRGVIYAVMGVLALGLALGIGGGATDQSGSLKLITAGPTGKALLLAVAFGLGAYSIWGFVRAIFDPLHRGRDAPGIAERLGFAWSGVAYAAIVLFALRLLAGTSQAGSHDSAQSTIARILTVPGGHWVAIVIGVIAIAAGLAQLVEAARATFKKDLKRFDMNRVEKQIVDGLGRFGMLSRGITFGLVGWFVLQGGLHRDPSQVHGFAGAFIFLLNQPYGRPLLGMVAAGFIALGLHSFACARWIRLLGSRP